MPARKLTFDPTGYAPGNKAVFHLEQNGPLGEGEIEQELAPLLHKYHPALDDQSGKLKQQPGVRELVSLGPEFFLTPPDASGVSHFGGIRLPYKVKDAFLAELRANGWQVEE